MQRAKALLPLFSREVMEIRSSHRRNHFWQKEVLASRFLLPVGQMVRRRSCGYVNGVFCLAGPPPLRDHV